MNPTQNTVLTPTQIAQAVRLTRKTLDDSAEYLPYDITERLRAARVQALAGVARKPVVIQEKHLTDGLLGWLQRMPVFAKTLVAVPALCLAMVAIQTTNQNNIAAPMALSASLPASAAVDPNVINIQAILTEQVPLQAYLDDDFNHFIDQDKHDSSKEIAPQSKGKSSHVGKNTIIQALR